MAVRNYDKWEAAFFFLFFLYVACLGVGISPLSAFILAAKPRERRSRVGIGEESSLILGKPLAEE